MPFAAKAETRTKRVVSGASAIVKRAGSGQLVALALSPAIARLYSPRDLGLFGVLLAVVTILSSASALRLELAIPLTPSKETLHAATTLAAAAVVCVAGIAGAGVLLIGQRLAGFAHVPDLVPYLWVIPALTVVAGAYRIFMGWRLREKNYRTVGRGSFAGSAGTVVLQTAAAPVLPGSVGLILGYALGRVLALLALLNWHREQRERFQLPHPSFLKDAMVRYWRFPLFSGSAALVSGISMWMPELLLAVVYGPKVTGWFMLGRKVLGAPVGLVGAALTQAVDGETSEAIRLHSEPVARIVRATARRTALTALLPAVVVVLVAPVAFPLVFGRAWERTGVFISILTPMFLARLAVTPVADVLSLVGRQLWQLYWDCCVLVLVAGTFVTMRAVNLGPTAGIGLFSAVMTLSYVSLYIVTLVAVRSSDLSYIAEHSDV